MREHITKFDDSVAVRRSKERNHWLWDNKAVPKVTEGKHHDTYKITEEM